MWIFPRCCKPKNGYLKISILYSVYFTIVYLVIASDHAFIRNFFYEAFPFSFTEVEIETCTQTCTSWFAIISMVKNCFDMGCLTSGKGEEGKRPESHILQCGGLWKVSSLNIFEVMHSLQLFSCWHAKGSGKAFSWNFLMCCCRLWSEFFFSPHVGQTHSPAFSFLTALFETLWTFLMWANMVFLEAKDLSHFSHFISTPCSTGSWCVLVWHFNSFLVRKAIWQRLHSSLLVWAPCLSIICSLNASLLLKVFVHISHL